MASFFHALGLGRSAPFERVPCYAAGSIVYSFVFAYAAQSPRFIKLAYGLDHNVAPREDVAVYGDAAVKAGKLSPKQLALVKRVEAAHLNAVEHFPFFVGAVLFALHAKLPAMLVNRICATYIATRAGYAAAYYYIDSHPLSYVRSALWWASNATCMYAFYEGGKAINAF